MVDGCGARAVSRKTPIYFINRILLQRKKNVVESLEKSAIKGGANGKSLNFFFLNVCCCLKTLAVEDSWLKSGGQIFFTELIHTEGVPKK